MTPTNSTDWLGAIGLALTIGGIIVAAVIAYRMKTPEANKTSAETIKTLFQQVNDSLQQIQELQNQRTEDRKLIDELRTAPSQLFELHSKTTFRILPEPKVDSQESTIARINGGAIE